MSVESTLDKRPLRVTQRSLLLFLKEHSCRRHENCRNTHKPGRGSRTAVIKIITIFQGRFKRQGACRRIILAAIGKGTVRHETAKQVLLRRTHETKNNKQQSRHVPIGRGTDSASVSILALLVRFRVREISVATVL